MRNVERIIVLYPGETSSERINKPANYSFSRLLLRLKDTDQVPVYFLNWSDRFEKYGCIEFIHFNAPNFARVVSRCLFAKRTLIISQLHHYRRHATFLRSILPDSRLLVRLGGVYNGGTYLRSPAFERYARRQLAYLRRVDMVVSTADGTPVDLYMERVGVPKERYRKWLNGFPAIENAGGYTRQRQVTCIARLSPEKAVDYVIESFASALPRLKERHSLVVVGEGPELSNLRALSAKLGIDRQVEFVGESFDVARYLYSSRVLVTGLANNTVMEAIATSTPVITVDLGETAQLYGSYPDVHVVPYPPGGYGRIPPEFRASLVSETASRLVSLLNAFDESRRNDARPPLYSWDERIRDELELYDSLFEITPSK